MKIAVFSDIHGNYQALKAILKRIGNKYDKIIYLGDAVGFGPDSLLCAKTIQESNIIYILGNHELYCTRGASIDEDVKDKRLEHHKWVLKSLKDYKIIDDNNLRYDIEINNKNLSFFHFFLNNNKYPYEHLDILGDDRYKEIFNKEKANYIFYGHNHTEEHYSINNKEYYGIGSSGCNPLNKTYFYSIYINENISIKKIEVRYKRHKFNNRINSMKYPDKENIKRIFFGM